MSTGEKSHEVKSQYRKDREIGGALWSGLVREGGREEEVVLSSQLNTKKVPATGIPGAETSRQREQKEQRFWGRNVRDTSG